MTSRLTVPIRLNTAPTQGGMVIPYITVRHRDGRAHFSTNDPRRHHRCLLQARCSVCGQPLADRLNRQPLPSLIADHAFVLLLRPSDLLQGYSSEPGLHAECAAYAERACPMLNGSRTHYRRALDLASDRCTDAACECRGWANAADIQARAGARESPFYRIRSPLHTYRLHQEEGGRVRGIRIDARSAETARLVTPGHPDDLEVARILLLGLPWQPPATS
ncbi:hypothetical protein [Nonomuraea sp. NPDC050202]|uniref:hypothetical protein n=1 Tax=Nonomuraea sp. NPDC050202 TaxID=3155035 RepID=UPI0034036C69